MIKLQAKRFELNFLLKLSDLKSNFTLTLSYLNPALNNPGQLFNSETTTSSLFPTQYTVVSSVSLPKPQRMEGRWKIKQIMSVLKLSPVGLQLELIGSQIRRR